MLKAEEQTKQQQTKKRNLLFFRSRRREVTVLTLHLLTHQLELDRLEILAAALQIRKLERRGAEQAA